MVSHFRNKLKQAQSERHFAVADYRTNSPYIGSSVGRVANRIREATFSLDGQTYTVSRNVSPHTLHGGETGFNKANWAVSSMTENSVTFKHVSVSGDMGYPGTLEATATYTLADSGEVGVAYTATADQPTIVNLVNHTYFNLTQEVSQCKSRVGLLLSSKLPRIPFLVTSSPSMLRGTRPLTTSSLL